MHRLLTMWCALMCLCGLAFAPVALAAKGATYVSQSVPSTMQAGQTATVTVVMQNTGTTTWGVSAYKLAIQPQIGGNWGISQVDLPAAVAPGNSATFTFTITAPATAGSYYFAWSMRQNTTFFGENTPITTIAVTTTGSGGGGGGSNDAQFIAQTVPASMVAGQSYPVSVQMKNTGSAIWKVADSCVLAAQNPAGNTTWGLGSVSVGGPITIGATKTFNFSVTAPAASGSYDFQWQMRCGSTWFGDLSTNAAVAVTNPPPPPPPPPPAPSSESPGATPLPSMPGTFSKTEVITYYDDTSKWVLGQVASVTCVSSLPASTSCDGNDVMQQTTYNAASALPETTSAFGKLQQTLTYNTDGTVATVKDGRNNTTTFSNWKRGIPQTIVNADGTSQSAVVNDSGWIESVTNEVAAKTCYSYDAMGRLSGITYPSETQDNVCNTSKWAATTRSFVPVASAEYGIAAGHWRLTETTGNAVKITYYDGLWRPLLVREYDAGNVSGTERFTRTAYDADGRVSFASYPSATSNPSTGVWTFYDPLGRVTSVSQDSELGQPLTTTTEYLNGFLTRVTNPRGFQTVTSYLTYDQPSTDWPLQINAPDGASTTIARDVFGKPLSLTRGGVTRSYGYNANQELCRSEEPETGTTLYAYDAAGNLSASSAGLPAGTACGSTNTRTVTRSYDARNRLQTLSFPDGNGNQSWTYTADGLPSTVTTSNSGNSVTNTYAYNKRRLLTGEAMTADALQGWSVGYGYNALAQVISEAAPASVAVNYTVNALGQTTAISARPDAGTTYTLASNASYYANGALRQFTYGNGIVHTMTQNARQLPSQSTDGSVLKLATTFDANGNVSAITDGTPAARQTKTMAYDGLDRLTSASSPMFGTASYAYDALDNLTQVSLSGGSLPRTQYYCYTASNQVAFVRSGPQCTGNASPALTALSYDLQGNLASKNGTTYTFDYGNRLRSTANQSYRYDADGRRVRQDSAGASLKYSYYAKDGRLLWQRDEPASKRINNVYLAGSLLAEITRPIGNTTPTISYFHTDALGSPIAKTNAAGAIIETSEYEPYGRLLNRSNDDRAGYTGHVMDAVSGLTYMQQRYYDPGIGRFLSVDPVTAYSNPVGSFNRYRYGNSNPYKFTDPDGRQSWPTPQNFNVDMSKRVPNDVSNSWKTAEQAAAPKAVYATGSVGDAAGGGFVGGQAQGASVTGALSLKGASVSGNGPQALLTTPAGAVQLQASRGGIEKQTLNAQVVGASVGLGSYEVGISSLTSASAINNLDTKTTISIPGLSVSWGENKTGAGWAIGISIVKPSASLSFIRTEKPTEP